MSSNYLTHTRYVAKYLWLYNPPALHMLSKMQSTIYYPNGISAIAPRALEVARFCDQKVR